MQAFAHKLHCGNSISREKSLSSILPFPLKFTKMPHDFSSEIKEIEHSGVTAAWCWWCVEAFAHNSSSCEGRDRRPQRGRGLGPSFIYSWSISYILEHKLFYLGLLGSSGLCSSGKKINLNISFLPLRVFFFQLLMGKKNCSIRIKKLLDKHKSETNIDFCFNI